MGDGDRVRGGWFGTADLRGWARIFWGMRDGDADGRRGRGVNPLLRGWFVGGPGGRCASKGVRGGWGAAVG